MGLQGKVGTPAVVVAAVLTMLLAGIVYDVFFSPSAPSPVSSAPRPSPPPNPHPLNPSPKQPEIAYPPLEIKRFGRLPNSLQGLRLGMTFNDAIRLQPNLETAVNTSPPSLSEKGDAFLSMRTNDGFFITLVFGLGRLIEIHSEARPTSARMMPNSLTTILSGSSEPLLLRRTNAGASTPPGGGYG